MTFQKPFAGTFAYKGIIPSSVMNLIDGYFPNALDKTGDNASTGGGITGLIGIETGGSITTQGGNVTVSSGDVLFVNAGGAIEASGTGTFISALAGCTLLVSSTSDLVLQGTLSGAGSGNAFFSSGFIIRLLSGTVFDGYGVTNMMSGSVTNLLGTVNTNSWANWVTPQGRYITQATQVGQALTGSWTTLVQGISSNAVGNQWVVPLERLHNGATLDQLVVTFQVWLTHSGVPANLPSLSVVRYNNFNLDSAEALGIPDPQSFSPTPSSGSAWYDGQATQFLVYDCIHNNVIDNSQYTYYVIITDESGTNSQPENNYGNITMQFTGIPNQSWQL
jgi:hypothetical protein